MSTTAKSIAANFTHAVTFPEVVVRFDEMLNDGVSGTSDFADVISRDPGLAATLLKFANSPLYGFSGQVSTIDRAIALIGMRAIGNLVLAVSIKTSFDKVPDNIMSMDEFWRHSLCCALASQGIADIVCPAQRDVLFTAGLVHNIGQLAMLSQIPNACVDVIVRSQQKEVAEELYELERELIGFDHHQVGAEIARAWNFPTILQDTIAFHHIPDEAPRHQFENWIVHAGNSIAEIAVLKMDWFSNTPPVSRSAMAHIGLNEEKFLPLVPQVQSLFQEMRPVFRLAA